ncbi:hypothetical protein KI387_041895, partial [Taxus chinensis]
MNQERSDIMQMFRQQQAMDFSQKSSFASSIPVAAAAGIQHRNPHLQGLFMPAQSTISGKQSGSAQLTIFYGGMVNVYDDISADKAQAIMLLASTLKPIQNNGSQPTTKSDLPIARKNSLQRFLEKRNH